MSHTGKPGMLCPDMDEGPPPPSPAPRQARWADRWRLAWRQAQRLPLTMMIASLLTGLGIVQLSFQVVNSAYRSVTWSRETRDTRHRVQTLQRDVQVLKAVQANSSSPEYLQEQARCNGYVGVNERVVVARGAPQMTGEPCKTIRLP